MFSWPNKLEHASFGRNKTSVELAQKNLADLHCKYFYATPKHENFLCHKKKHYLPARVFLKKLPNIGLKISVRSFTTNVGYRVFNSIREQNLHDVC